MHVHVMRATLHARFSNTHGRSRPRGAHAAVAQVHSMARAEVPGTAPRETMDGDSLPYHLFMHCSGEREPRRSDTAAQLMSSSTTRPSRCVPRQLPSLSPAALASCVPWIRVQLRPPN